MRRTSFLFGCVAVAGLAGLSAVSLGACFGEPFDPQSRVDSVRLFSVRADKPYAKPGETVTMEALLTDARKTRTRPLKHFWLISCFNPREDLYYLCFAPTAVGGATLAPIGIDAGPLDGGALDAGSGGGTSSDNPLAALPVGVDLNPFLQQGLTTSFRMPDDVIQPREGSDPYGLAIVFDIACAGSVRLAEINPSAGPQQVPILCTDEAGNKLPPSDYVIGISRVYSYAERVNTNPIIEKITLDGNDVDVAAGITLDRCTTEKSSDCPESKINVVVPDVSWEANPSEGAPDLREQIWVAYYTDRGDVNNDARLLFDTRKGRVDDSAVKFKPFKDPGDGTVWMVVHDNRGGVSWSVVPIHIK